MEDVFRKLEALLRQKKETILQEISEQENFYLKKLLEQQEALALTISSSNQILSDSKNTLATASNMKLLKQMKSLEDRLSGAVSAAEQKAAVAVHSVEEIPLVLNESAVVSALGNIGHIRFLEAPKFQTVRSEKIPSGNVTLKWSAVSEAVCYELEMLQWKTEEKVEESAFVSLLKGQATERCVSTEPSMSYSFRVRCSDPTNSSEWSLCSLQTRQTQPCKVEAEESSD